jgi:hypothetical protein
MKMSIFGSVLMGLALHTTVVASSQNAAASSVQTDIADQSVLDRKETCWRTNRQTKQKFRIC